MPALRRPTVREFISLPAREALVAGEADVLVVGGGPAGLGAAVGAAGAGAKVILAERYGFLGGNATAALVMPLMSFHTQRAVRGEPQPPRFGKLTFYPADVGTGHPAAGGVVTSLIERLVLAGGAIEPSLETGYVVPFDPEVFKWCALDMLEEAGVQLLLHSFASGTITHPITRAVEGVVFETKTGPMAVRAKCVVDATGDGDVAAHAGAPFEIGRKEDGLVPPMTRRFRVADFNRNAFETYVREHPADWRGVHGLWDLVRKATRAGDLKLPREDVLFFGTPHETEVSVNSTRVLKVLGTEVWDLTYAEMESRKQARQVAHFLRKYVPGFARSWVTQTGTHIGVRETRRFIGEYILTADDVLEARKFDDVIARGTYPIDIHNPNGRGTNLKRLPPGEAYDIPLRSLIPQGVDGLILSGRCISGTHEAHSSYRATAIALATGQAAGVCAAISSKLRRPARRIPALLVQDELLSQGADLVKSA